MCVRDMFWVLLCYPVVSAKFITNDEHEKKILFVIREVQMLTQRLEVKVSWLKLVTTYEFPLSFFHCVLWDGLSTFRRALLPHIQ